MNSQFKNSNFGFYLYAFIIIIIAAASIFVFWYMVSGYKLGTYEENTILGSVYLGGLRETDVEGKVNDRINRWLNDDSIVFEVTYQGYSYEIDRELFFFDIETSTFTLQNGVTNQLVVNFQATYRQDTINAIASLPYLVHISDNLNYEQLMNDILADAGLMKSFSSKDLELYINDYDVAEVVINTTVIDIPEGVDVNDMFDGITDVYDAGRIVLPSKELYDLVDHLGGNLSDIELGLLGSALLELSLASNFQINEVHYVPLIDFGLYTIDNFPYYGHNVYINKIVGNSFSLYNPNELDYYFQAVIVDGDLEISLVGLPFSNEIEVIETKTILDFITQYTTDDTILQSGHQGVVVEVTRVITDVYDEVIFDKVIIFEFYPPVKEIVIG